MSWLLGKGQLELLCPQLHYKGKALRKLCPRFLFFFFFFKTIFGHYQFLVFTGEITDWPNLWNRWHVENTGFCFWAL